MESSCISWAILSLLLIFLPFLSLQQSVPSLQQSQFVLNKALNYIYTIAYKYSSSPDSLHGKLQILVSNLQHISLKLHVCKMELSVMEQYPTSKLVSGITIHSFFNQKPRFYPWFTLFFYVYTVFTLMEISNDSAIKDTSNPSYFLSPLPPT